MFLLTNKIKNLVQHGDLDVDRLSFKFRKRVRLQIGYFKNKNKQHKPTLHKNFVL